MKLVHILNAPFALQYISGQARYMRRNGIDLAAVTPAGPALDAFGVSEQVPVYPVPIHRKISPLSDLLTIARLVALLRRVRPTIVHAHTPKGGLLGMISAALVRVPVRVYTLHGFTYMTATGLNRTLLKNSDRMSCRLAHRVICVSPSIRDVALADRMCAPEKLVVLGHGSANGVDAECRFNPELHTDADRTAYRGRYGVPEGARVLTFVGRLVGDKGIRELVEAWEVLRARYQDLHLILAGPIEARDAVPADVLQRLIDDSRAHLPGLVTDVNEVLSITDLLVLPSYREGLPTAPLEAAAMGVPVVATTIPGCVDAVDDGVTGTLVPPRNVDALRQAIERYLDDPQLRHRHGTAGRERVRREFRQESVWDAIYREYDRLLASRGISVPQGEDREALGGR